MPSEHNGGFCGSFFMDKEIVSKHDSVFVVIFINYWYDTGIGKKPKRRG